ncbi:hypothetical protein PU629_00580 [Pullulanibacillus sp. KACC 23026]|uniref:hypothetical protein n=1 Tax=Pullulanibacillus sp. KACC 23026 TaxID=3028315 RepID=UPI0023B0B4A5|nr:hypothetical protein [Pullulanibacillus sp. KACC 23026]WEG12884.1 hypothetical protein PU629_00580 [Pullulanibacillus sp. KACC 23026]
MFSLRLAEIGVMSVRYLVILAGFAADSEFSLRSTEIGVTSFSYFVTSALFAAG